MTNPTDTQEAAPTLAEGGAASNDVGYARYVGRQLLRRLGQLAILVFSISTLLFFLLRLTGDPALVLVGDLASEESIQRVRDFYGLDRPLIVQYFLFVGQAVKLDFGTSIVSFQDAFGLVMNKLPATAVLAAAAIALNLFVSLTFGTWLGYRPERLSRRVGMVSVLVSQGIPGFVIGLILIQLFAVKWQLLPSIGNEGLKSLILPSITLASFMLPRVIRLTAANVDKAMREDYVRTARAAGFTPTAILWRHVLPNALLGTVALVGVQFGFLLSGSLITESLFAWPGLGQLLIESVTRLDFPVVQASVAVVAVLVFAVTTLTDLLFPLIDPRLKSQHA
jgi:peptide/nickel transport system permease protein